MLALIKINRTLSYFPNKVSCRGNRVPETTFWKYERTIIFIILLRTLEVKDKNKFLNLQGHFKRVLDTAIDNIRTVSASTIYVTNKLILFFSVMGLTNLNSCIQCMYVLWLWLHQRNAKQPSHSWDSRWK